MEKKLAITKRELNIIAEDMVTNYLTIREAASKYGITKTTLHKYIHKYGKEFMDDPKVYEKLLRLLKMNRDEAPYRGGLATSEKYFKLRYEKIKKLKI